MNYKLLFPSYRTRYQFVKEKLKHYGASKFGNGLNLGMGEGDYDHMIVSFCDQLVSCDINKNDVDFARKLNSGIKTLSYQVDNALDLSFDDQTFDLLISVDVMEHVGKPEQMTKEISRVLKKGGVALISFPQVNFPITYDPINRILRAFTKKKISFGAYGFGHEYLIDGEQFKIWAQKYGLTIIEEHNLSGYFVGMLEMYWPGIMQKLLKDNAQNLPSNSEKNLKLRPTNKEPFLAKFTDVLIGLDRFLFSKSKYSIGKAFVLKK